MSALGRPLIALLALMIALAGCVGLPQPDVPSLPGVPDASWAEAALPFGDHHDHSDPAQHQGLTTPNFHVVGWDPLVSAHEGRTAGGYHCGDAGTTAEGAKLSFIPSFVRDVAFIVSDVTDAAAPKTLGELVLPDTHVYDLAVSPDARYVFLATDPLGWARVVPVDEPGVANARGESTPFFLDACGSARPLAAPVGLPAAPYNMGLVLVDVADPTMPQIVDYKALPVLGAHSVSATIVDGKTLALASVTNLAHQGSYYVIYSVAETPAGPRLVEELVWRPTPMGPDREPIINGHGDGVIAKHPLTGQTLAYLADWDGGLVILDVTNPRAPAELGRWSDYTRGDKFDDSGSIHGALPLPEAWDGKHYTIIGQEILRRPKDTPTGVTSIIDTTDPANPVRVGAWTLPVDVEWDQTLIFSPHYFDIMNRTLLHTMYHAGVWAIDLSDVTQPKSVGVFIPDKVSPQPPDERVPFGDRYFGTTPLVMDLKILGDGTMVVWDATSGLYMVHYDDSRPMPAPAPWPIEV